MRCYISKEYDISAYKDYLEKICKCEFRYCKSEFKNFYCLQSKLLKKYILFRGENKDILTILIKTCILEQNIIIISCTAKKIVQCAKKYNPSLFLRKKIYFPKYSKDKEFLTIYDEDNYSLKFAPCKAELMLGEDCDINNIDIRLSLQKHFNCKTIREIINEQI